MLEDNLRALEVKQALTLYQSPSLQFVVPSKSLSQFTILAKPLHTSKPRSAAREKADYYAAILDELKGRSSMLSSSGHQRLLLGLLGDPVSAKVAKESSALLKTFQREAPQAILQRCNPGCQFRHQRPCPQRADVCFKCGYPGQYARDCGQAHGCGGFSC